MNQVFLALGSNIRPEFYLPRAVRLLSNYGVILKRSSVWQSSPVGDENQADFLNAAILMETPLEASKLRLDIIAGIEQQLDRVRDPDNKNGPRTIDIDLVLFNEEQLEIGHRIIPDPEILERAFLAAPLAELAPQYVVPGVNKTLEQIANKLTSTDENPLICFSDVQI
ncbi:2-amino-4-hydroxy-6-hydroxymethyldihydropteridine diphosphokinase [Gimesia aquarii]|uniref:2-amino-4-hydroxy-6-hydroxymethyldihydropteridine pyrophosphokinase n=1 Tax=Gimesia aquarii TaxID=2527964 RepID=A0A517X151_9PLAN|nr:2-amino-4-hydroxy-6-hydroxymethyldihydropteridine diphosphokinase [Gimesia aquarii]QDU11236.1 2-amino-4-hydroxy-6-hydroxymethyldihydropteridine pyrophosphokinase [Gimesia aquarii]